MSLSYFRIIMTVFRLEKATQKWIHFCTCSNLEKELNCYRNIFFSLSISVSLECMIFYFSKSVQLYISYVINIMISYSLQKSMQLIEDSKHSRNDLSSCQASIFWFSGYLQMSVSPDLSSWQVSILLTWVCPPECVSACVYRLN